MGGLNLQEKEKTVESVPMGARSYYAKTITEGDVVLYSGITGDFNALSINQEFASSTPWKKRVVPNMLVATYTWPVSTELVSPGAVTISQSAKFLKPVYIGDTITVVGEVVEKIMEKKTIIVQTRCYNQNDELVMDGSAVELMRVR